LLDGQAHRPSANGHGCTAIQQELQMQCMLQLQVATWSSQHDYHVRNAFVAGASWPTADKAGQPPNHPTPLFTSTSIHPPTCTTYQPQAHLWPSGCPGRKGRKGGGKGLAMEILGASWPFNLSK